MEERNVRRAEIAWAFLKIGAMSYGGPAIMGIMQSELQEKRRWIDQARFVEGLALVNMLPGPGATQLGIFIGHAVGGVAGGMIAGLCFILPAFFIMLALASVYATWGALPVIRSAFYGIGPVVLGIFAVAIYRLARNTIKDRRQTAMAIAAAAILWLSSLGLVATLMAAGCAGIALFDSWRRALVATAIFALLFAIASVLPVGIAVEAGTGDFTAPGLGAIAVFFLKVGTLTFGGGLSMLAFMEDQLVSHLGWLTHTEFVDGLALGQLTPGPILMLAAFIGLKLHGFAGASVAAIAIFLPSFVMMLTILPLLRRMSDLRWLKAFMRGVAPAVIGAVAVSLAQITPHAAPDWFTAVVLTATIALLLWRNTAPLPMMLAGAAIGIVAKTGRGVARVRELFWLA